MALIHGRLTVIKIDSTDLSTYCKTSEITKEYDDHDVTTYGNTGHVHRSGLTDGKFTVSGNYDTTSSTGPRAKFNTIYAAGANVTILRQPEGAGSTKPQDSFSGMLKSYVETSPVDDYVSWSAEFSISGAVDVTAQS